MMNNWKCGALALLIAGAMALIAFTLGQVMEGLGMMFVIIASTGWVAYCAARQRRYQRRP